MAERYAIRGRDSRVWHIPTEDDQAACGEPLTEPIERRYLPARLEPEDVVCDLCRVVTSLPTKQAH